MRRIMFLCTGNSCRSQMAEGWARSLGEGLIEAHSAGLKPAGIHPLAIKVMGEVGIDIAGQSSQAIDTQLLNGMDLLITLCGSAAEACPVTPPQIERRHWPIDDPAQAQGGEAELLPVFRRVRDEIQERVEQLVAEIKSAPATTAVPEGSHE